MIKQILVIGAAVSVIALNGCSTARGFGQDLEDLGRIIQGQTPKNYESHRTVKKVRAQKFDSAPVVTGSVVNETTSYSYAEPVSQTAGQAVTEVSQAPVTSYPYTPAPTSVSPTPTR